MENHLFNENHCIGATYRKRTKKWECRVRYLQKVYWIGSYSDKETAGRIYDVASKIILGPGRNMNYDGQPPDGMSVSDVFRLILESGFPRETLISRLADMARIRENFN
jgi:hypothetical protein